MYMTNFRARYCIQSTNTISIISYLMHSFYPKNLNLIHLVDMPFKVEGWKQFFYAAAYQKYRYVYGYAYIHFKYRLCSIYKTWSQQLFGFLSRIRSDVLYASIILDLKHPSWNSYFCPMRRYLIAKIKWK